MAKRRRVDDWKGIYCLEGDWFGKKDKTTVEPVLRLLETVRDLRVPYLHKGVATRRSWSFVWDNGLSRASRLIQSFHGQPSEIELGQG